MKSSPHQPGHTPQDEPGQDKPDSPGTSPDPSEMATPGPNLATRLLPTIVLGIATGVWAIVGSIPIRVVGQSVLIQPRSIVPFQNRVASGQVLEIRVKPGDSIQVGQILAILDLPELQEQLV